MFQEFIWYSPFFITVYRNVQYVFALSIFSMLAFPVHNLYLVLFCMPVQTCFLCLSLWCCAPCCARDFNWPLLFPFVLIITVYYKMLFGLVSTLLSFSICMIFFQLHLLGDSSSAWLVKLTLTEDTLAEYWHNDIVSTTYYKVFFHCRVPVYTYFHCHVTMYCCGPSTDWE